ncbi:MAG: hypothetical protein VB038_02920 [Methanobrevibacter sp.]|nr:hypothetical protein [Methanobrevibacter sp.]MEA4956658.1 hypothetical protein [Methanobrevibacter sp.]
MALNPKGDETNNIEKIAPKMRILFGFILNTSNFKLYIQITKFYLLINF